MFVNRTPPPIFHYLSI